MKTECMKVIKKVLLLLSSYILKLMSALGSISDQLSSNFRKFIFSIKNST